MTSGEISSRLAIRVSTSARSSSGSSVTQLRGVGRVQVREDQRDRLRMLAEDELRELLRVGLLERREAGRRLERPLHAVEDAPRAAPAPRVTIEHPARVRRRRRG